MFRLKDVSLLYVQYTDALYDSATFEHMGQVCIFILTILKDDNWNTLPDVSTYEAPFEVPTDLLRYHPLRTEPGGWG